MKLFLLIISICCALFMNSFEGSRIKLESDNPFYRRILERKDKRTKIIILLVVHGDVIGKIRGIQESLRYWSTIIGWDCYGPMFEYLQNLTDSLNKEYKKVDKTSTFSI